MKEKRVESICQVDMNGLKLPVIAAYDHPDDFPDRYVARVFDGASPTDTVMIKDDFKEIREDIETNTNMVFFPRGAEDVPSLIGAWI